MPLKNGWSNGTVRRLLRSRAIIGEYQPHVRPNRKIAKEGDPVPNYYPPLFTDDPGLFHRVQTALTMRNGAGGKGLNGKQFTNLYQVPLIRTDVPNCAGRWT
jgi:hypothetical protein